MNHHSPGQAASCVGSRPGQAGNPPSAPGAEAQLGCPRNMLKCSEAGVPRRAGEGASEVSRPPLARSTSEVQAL